MAPERYELLILGAGLAGCALAVHSARQHAGQILVADPRTVAGGATGRAAGIVTEQLWNRWDVEVARETRIEYEERGRRLGRSAYRTTGFLRWSSKHGVRVIVEEARQRFRAWGVQASFLEAEELAERFPWGRFDRSTFGLYSSTDACVNPTELAADYAEEARRLGVQFALGDAVSTPRFADGAWTLSGKEGEVRARRLVLATGAWTKRLAHELGRALPIAPYRTQAALLRPPVPAPEAFPAAHDIDLDVYLRPEEGGRILIGDGTELKEVDPERVSAGGTPEFLAHMAEALAQRWPSWAESEVAAAWSGVCDATPDRRPIIGPVDARRELYVIAGFNGFGVMRAAGAARRLAALLWSSSGTSAPEAALAAVRPDRFARPELPFTPQPGFTLEAGATPRC